MNKTSLLLLVTLIQSQSNGVLLSTPNHSKKFERGGEFQLEDWENSESPYLSDISKGLKSYKKRSTNDVLTRRSILDKTFMRFGRDVSQICAHKNCETLKSVSQQPNDKNHFRRTTRGMKDNFIRFGRGPQDNFIRFGRGSKEGYIPLGILPEEFIRSAKSPRDNFIRFGRGDTAVDVPSEEFHRYIKSPKDNFIRFGREHITIGKEAPEEFFRFSKSPKDNFIRFGRGDASDDGSFSSNNRFHSTKGSKEDFIRFEPDIGSTLSEEFHRFVKSPRDSFIRFGRRSTGNDGVLDEFHRSVKSPGDSFIRFGKMDKNFIRFGRGERQDKYLLGAPVFFGQMTDKSDESKEDFLENTGSQRGNKNGTKAKENAEDGIDEKEAEFDGDNKDVNMDFVIRIKRNAVEFNKTNYAEKNSEKANDRLRYVAKKFHRLSEQQSGDRYVDFGKSFGSSYFRRIPEYFPEKVSRVQYARAWDDLENQRSYSPLSPPFFPVLTKF